MLALQREGAVAAGARDLRAMLRGDGIRLRISARPKLMGAELALAAALAFALFMLAIGKV
jgi:hypothetical protein